MCAYSEVLSAYVSAPIDADDTREKYLAARTPRPLRPNQMNYGVNVAKWHTSVQKSYWGDAATAQSAAPGAWPISRNAGSPTPACTTRRV